MLQPFKRPPHKLVKNTQTTRRPTNCLSMFDHFVGLAFKRLKESSKTSKT